MCCCCYCCRCHCWRWSSCCGRSSSSRRCRCCSWCCSWWSSSRKGGGSRSTRILLLLWCKLSWLQSHLIQVSIVLEIPLIRYHINQWCLWILIHDTLYDCTRVGMCKQWLIGSQRYIIEVFLYHEKRWILTSCCCCCCWRWFCTTIDGWWSWCCCGGGGWCSGGGGGGLWWWCNGWESGFNVGDDVLEKSRVGTTLVWWLYFGIHVVYECESALVDFGHFFVLCFCFSVVISFFMLILCLRILDNHLYVHDNQILSHLEARHAQKQSNPLWVVRLGWFIRKWRRYSDPMFHSRLRTGVSISAQIWKIPWTNFTRRANKQHTE